MRDTGKKMYKNNEETKEHFRKIRFNKFYDFFKKIGGLEPIVVKKGEKLIGFFDEVIEEDVVVDNRVVVAFLDGLGLKEFSFLNAGQNASVFDIGNEQVLRITLLIDEKKRPDIPQVLQPVYTKIISNCRIEALPKLNTKDVTNEHLQELAEVLKNTRYNFHDQNLSEIGLLFDGTPVIVDGGAVIKKRARKTEPDLENNLRWKGKQEEHLAQTGLTKGEIKGADIKGKHTKRLANKKVADPESELHR